MPKKLSSIRLSILTQQQIAALEQAYGLRTSEIIAMAMDRMYQLEYERNPAVPHLLHVVLDEDMNDDDAHNA